MSGAVEVSGSPMMALFSDATLVVGVERDGGDLKVYLGQRWKGVYCVLPAGDEADQLERSFGFGHLWLRPVPGPDQLFQDARRTPEED